MIPEQSRNVVQVLFSSQGYSYMVKNSLTIFDAQIALSQVQDI